MIGRDLLSETMTKFTIAFPQEVLVAIIRLLDTKAKCNAACVSKLWKKVLYMNPHLWRSLVLSNKQSLGSEKQGMAQILFKHKPVDSIHSSFRFLSQNNYPVLNSGANSQLLKIFATPSSIERLRLVTKLELSYTNIDLEIFTIPHIADSLYQLTHLYIDGCSSVDSYSLYALRLLKSLIHLDLSHCNAVDDAGLEVLVYTLPQIQSLNLSYLYRLTDKGIQRLFKLPNLTSINLLGCYRIRTYPWATSNKQRKSVMYALQTYIQRYPVKELLLGEDSRIQTGGFWLLWCCWNWNMTVLAATCPFLVTLRINMVLFDLPSDGITNLLIECKNLKNLGLVLDRTSVPALCENADKLNQLDSLELTCHIGLTLDCMAQLVEAKCLKKLTILKFHSKHTVAFAGYVLSKFVKLGMPLEYLEINAEQCSGSSIGALGKLLYYKKCSSSDSSSSIQTQKAENPIQNLLIHNATLDNSNLDALNKCLTNTKELSLSNLSAFVPSVKLRRLVINSLMIKNLRKIEISSKSGFSDKDLAQVPLYCNQIQWAEFTFSFAYVKTLDALAKCKQLLYCKLHRYPASQKRLFKASDKECKAMLRFAKHSPRALRILDVGGEIGITNYILYEMGCAFSPTLHTIFLDSVQVSAVGILKFAELRWKSLKRIHIRNCLNVRFDIVQENFLIKALEVQVILDGGILGKLAPIALGIPM